MGIPNSKFDIDLRNGQFAEWLIHELLSDECGTIEVKRDFKVSETGNLAIEFRCRGRKSGISITEATWWAFVLDGPRYEHEVVLIIKASRLRIMANYFYEQNQWTLGGDDNASEMVLIPVTRLLAWEPPVAAPVMRSS